MKKYNVLLFERHKYSLKSNNFIITEVMAVFRGKHSDRSNEPYYGI